MSQSPKHYAQRRRLTSIPPASSGVFRRRAVEARPAPVSGRSAQRRVLLVDDDALVLRTMKRALGAHLVTAVASVDEARRAIDSTPEPFDVVVADLSMPAGGGICLHEWLVASRECARPRFVFATGGITSERDADYLERNRCAYLLKPIRFADLEGAILGHARAEDEST